MSLLQLEILLSAKLAEFWVSFYKSFFDTLIAFKRWKGDDNSTYCIHLQEFHPTIFGTYNIVKTRNVENWRLTYKNV